MSIVIGKTEIREARSLIGAFAFLARNSLNKTRSNGSNEGGCACGNF